MGLTRINIVLLGLNRSAATQIFIGRAGGLWARVRRETEGREEGGGM